MRFQIGLGDDLEIIVLFLNLSSGNKWNGHRNCDA